MPRRWAGNVRAALHGFRYLEISSRDATPIGQEDVRAVVLHADLPVTGAFACSDPLLEQLHRNIRWGQKGNFIEVPTDCPQRDECLGWTGDAQVFCRTACLLHECAGLLGKWCQDLADAQLPDGGIPTVAPLPRPQGSTDGGPAWSDAILIVPWTLYQFYGDTGLLERLYPAMVRYVDQLVAQAPDLIRAHPARGPGGFGDWLAIDGSGRTEGGTPKDLIGTAYLAHDAFLLARIARVLDREADAARFDDLHQRTRLAFRRRFVTPEGLLAAQTQTAYVLALAFDLIPAETKTEAVSALIRDIQARSMHLSTGFVGTPYLLGVLSDAGHLDVAYALPLQRSRPSWLYPVTQGATTIWERWDGWTHDQGFQDPAMNSFNHYAYGAVGSWLYQVVAGLDWDPALPGQQRLWLRPRPGGGLTYARASLRTMHGLAVCGWRLTEGRLEVEVQVPANASAVLHLPAASAAEVLEGGRPVPAIDHITVDGHRDGGLLLGFGAGSYVFTLADAADL